MRTWLSPPPSSKSSPTKRMSSRAYKDRVTVDKNGVVTAVSQGTAYIVAQTCNDLKASCLVTVTNPAAEPDPDPTPDPNPNTGSSVEDYTEEDYERFY